MTPRTPALHAILTKDDGPLWLVGRIAVIGGMVVLFVFWGLA